MQRAGLCMHEGWPSLGPLLLAACGEAATGKVST